MNAVIVVENESVITGRVLAPLSGDSLALHGLDTQQFAKWSFEADVSSSVTLLRSFVVVERNFLIYEISRRYDIRDAPSVIGFLRSNPDVIPILLEAPQHAVKHFKRTRITLQLIHCAENPDDIHLLASIQTPLSRLQAREALNKFDQDWWDKVMPQVNNKINFDIEYV